MKLRSRKGLLPSFPVEFDHEEDGRWIAEIPRLPGVMAYGVTKQDALRHVRAIALRTLADVVETGKTPVSISRLFTQGSVENANKMIRRYFPKGTDFRTVSQRNVDDAVSLINEKPRRILGYRSAIAVAEKVGMMRNIKREGVLTEG